MRILDPMSRLNLAAVKFMELGGRNRATVFGKVHQESMAPLMMQFQAVQSDPSMIFPGDQEGLGSTNTSARPRGAHDRISDRVKPSTNASITSAAGRRESASSKSSSLPRLTPEQVRDKISALSNYAQQHKLTMPRIGDEHVNPLAEDPELFQALLRRVREQWAEETEAREDEGSEDDSDNE